MLNKDFIITTLIYIFKHVLLATKPKIYVIYNKNYAIFRLWLQKKNTINDKLFNTINEIRETISNEKNYIVIKSEIGEKILNINKLKSLEDFTKREFFIEQDIIDKSGDYSNINNIVAIELSGILVSKKKIIRTIDGIRNNYKVIKFKTHW